MPYRRLPNTNKARLRALSTAVEVGERYDESYALAFPFPLLDTARQILPQYVRRMTEYEQSLTTQITNSKLCSGFSRNARMYVSHFIQVLNMCVQRGEIKKELKSLYGLNPEDFAVPDLMSDAKLAEWGPKIIAGEQQRLRQGGGAPIYNPPIAKVSVFFDQFIDKYRGMQFLQKSTVRTSAQIGQLNGQIDEVLLQIWNAVEAHFVHEPLAVRLEHCREYGLIYYYRKNEEQGSSSE